MRSRVLALLSITVMATALFAAASGYVVILKNGKMLRAKEPIKVEGNKVVVRLVTGTLATIPLDMVDIKATEKYNKMKLGDAILIDEEKSLLATPTPTPSLGSVAKLRTLATPTPSGTPKPTPTPSVHLRPAAYPNERTVDLFSELLDRFHVLSFRTSIGSQKNFLLIQVDVADENEAFQALEAVCKAYWLIAEEKPALAPAAVELELVTTAGEEAGAFRITKEMAQKLASGKMSVAEFWREYGLL